MRRAASVPSHATRVVRVCLTGMIAAVIAACPAQDASQTYTPAVTWDTANARVASATDTFHITVEVAEREDQRAYGMMERTSVPDDHGMIFIYGSEQSADAGFWMYRTRIPLDIAFFDGDGRIVTIRGMEPCPDADPRGCPTYPPGTAYHGALEMNRGWFASRGIAVGDRILLDR